jgi:hypothetical protein
MPGIAQSPEGGFKGGFEGGWIEIGSGFVSGAGWPFPGVGEVVRVRFETRDSDGEAQQQSRGIRVDICRLSANWSA